ncbi:MAG: acyloxyacyl hydrolase [Thermonemataceae bacterium]|nr:acyloxyacyl hydrolase [Thermonemataceae bacterium]
MKAKHCIFVILLFSFIQKIAAQKPLRIGILQDYGFVLKHSPKIGHLQTHPWASTIFMEKYHLGDKEWEERWHYPKTSFAFTYFDFRSPIIGKTLAISANIILPLARHQKWSLESKIGTGFVYATQPFDIQSNPQNNVLSNSWSYVLQTGFWFNYHLAKHWQLISALQLTHYSNGAYKLPNSGVNVISYALGAAYLLNPEQIKFKKTRSKSFVKQSYLDISSSIALIETVINQPTKHKIFNINFIFNRDISPGHRLQTGWDISWNEGIAYQINQKYAGKSNKPDYRRMAWLVGDELNLGKMSLNIQFGVYFYRQFEAISDMAFYQRYGLRYYPKPYFWLGAYLKSHAATAEAGEFTVGTHLRLSKKKVNPKN